MPKCNLNHKFPFRERQDYTLYFSNASVKLTHAQKRLGVQLNKKLSFNKYTNNKISKATKGIGLLCKLQPYFPRAAQQSFINLLYNFILIMEVLFMTSSLTHYLKKMSWGNITRH